jgi:hypothetical protein
MIGTNRKHPDNLKESPIHALEQFPGLYGPFAIPCIFFLVQTSLYVDHAPFIDPSLARDIYNCILTEQFKDFANLAVSTMSEAKSSTESPGAGATTETENIDTIRTISRVPANPNYYEKNGLRTEGDGMDHTHYNPVGVLMLNALLDPTSAQRLTNNSTQLDLL